jgi:2-haloacid dehalogenase
MLADIQDKLSLLTFDCYGTLIDWDRGIRDVLARVSGVPRESCDSLVEAYIRAEASIEQGDYQSYRDVQARALKVVAQAHPFDLPVREAHALSDALPSWLPFDDTNEALTRLKSQYTLGVLSNIDRDLFAGTCAHFDVDFDLVITAEDVRSYKPLPPHFTEMLRQTPAGLDGVLHVAQSLYHDAAPAAALGIQYVWINRYGQSRPADVPMLAEFPTLAALADALALKTSKEE